jgi:hypothetical protein
MIDGQAQQHFEQKVGTNKIHTLVPQQRLGHSPLRFLPFPFPRKEESMLAFSGSIAISLANVIEQRRKRAKQKVKTIFITKDIGSLRN